MSGWRRRFFAKGVVWRQLLVFGVHVVPFWLEPVFMAYWSLVFLLWGPGRRGVMRNLSVIKAGSWPVVNFLRTWRVFWNYAWSMADSIRFREQRVMPDWEFIGREYFEQLKSREGGAIIVTAHMGSYDLGAYVFSETSDRKIVMVRAPEVDPKTQQFEETQRARTQGLRVDFNTKSSELALDLLHSIGRGELVAIQGDRATPGIATLPATLFGKATRLPAGPFALAMASRVPVYPLFVVRMGRRKYQLVACEPIVVERRSRHRDDDLHVAVEKWCRDLESVLRRSWYQWFAFEPIEDAAA